jgi:hypothetical protein
MNLSWYSLTDIASCFSKELLLLEVHETFGYVLLPQLVLELLLGDGVGGDMSCGVSIPPICGGSF